MGLQALLLSELRQLLLQHLGGDRLVAAVGGLPHVDQRALLRVLPPDPPGLPHALVQLLVEAVVADVLGGVAVLVVQLRQGFWGFWR